MPALYSHHVPSEQIQTGFSHHSPKRTPQSVSPGTVTLIALSRFCFLWMLRKKSQPWKPDEKGFHFLSGQEWAVISVVCQGESANWIRDECLGSLSLPASEEPTSLSPSLMIPLRGRTGEGRGASGSSGTEWEVGKQREREKMLESSVSAPVVVAVIGPFTVVRRR